MVQECNFGVPADKLDCPLVESPSDGSPWRPRVGAGGVTDPPVGICRLKTSPYFRASFATLKGSCDGRLRGNVYIVPSSGSVAGPGGSLRGNRKCDARGCSASTEGRMHTHRQTRKTHARRKALPQPRATNWILGSAGRNPVCHRQETRTFVLSFLSFARQQT